MQYGVRYCLSLIFEQLSQTVCVVATFGTSEQMIHISWKWKDGKEECWNVFLDYSSIEIESALLALISGEKSP